VSADAPNIGSLVTWDHYLAWMEISDPSGKNGRVRVHDLDKKTTKTVAEGLYSGGVSWVRGGGDAVVYLSFEHLACDDASEKERTDSGCAQKPRAWEVYAADIKKGEKRKLVSSSGDQGKLLPVLPEVEWPYVVWTNPASLVQGRPVARGIFVYDLRKNKTHVVAPGAIVARAAIADGKVVFTGEVPGVNRWDLFSVRPDGSGSRRLTRSGKVIWHRAANRAVAWVEPNADKPDPAHPDVSIWTKSLGKRDKPVRIAKQGADPFPGDGFVVWITPADQGGELLAQESDGAGDPLALEPHPRSPQAGGLGETDWFGQPSIKMVRRLSR
jgi:hypothetical protein